MRKEQIYERITVSEKSGSGGFEPVEGFEPLEFARTIKQEDQEDQLYLDVKYRKLWFRLAYPLGRIASTIVRLPKIWRWQRQGSI